MKTKLLIIADDMTGTLDTGVQFARQGIAVSVIMNPESGWTDTEAEVLAVNSNTRHLTGQEAYDTVYRIVSEGKKAGIPYVYKKTDSALRGNVGAELSAALHGSGVRSLAFVPSYPEMDRVVRKGVHYIDGVPVSESLFGKDPFNPVLESDVAKLIHLQTDVPVRSMDELSEEGFILVEGGSRKDLYDAGVQLKQAGLLETAAGCAGFAKFLPDLLNLRAEEIPQLPDPGDQLLVISGSLNPVTLEQLDQAETCGFRRIHMRADQNPDALHAGLPEISEPWMILDSSDSDGSTVRSDEDSREAVRASVAENIGVLVSRLAEEYPGTVMIIGGDTLTACLKHLKCTQMRMLAEVYPGVVLSEITVNGTKRLLFSKSGGFGKETLLKDLKQWMEEMHHERN